MNMKKNFFLISILSCLISCTETCDDVDIDIVSTKTEETVVKERDPNYPWIPSDYKSIFTTTRNVVENELTLSHRQLLGYSLKNDVYPLEDTRNLGYKVIDIDKLYRDNPNYFTVWKNNTGSANSFSYATFDRYISNSTLTDNISGGFSLNLGLFSIGSKNNINTVFSKSIAENENATFGELNIIVRDSCYRMQYSSNIQSKIKEKYLSDVFKDELYNTHPSEFFSNYGGFVLTNFIVGGKATAQYAGIYKKTETNETKESKLGNEIDASYGFDFSEDEAGKVSGNLSLGRGNNSSISVTNEFSSITMSIKTLGGNSSFASFSIPKEINNTNVDLSAWISSLNDKNTHNIVEFGRGGLIPITDFIIEANLRNQINKYYETGVSQIEALQEPYIRYALITRNSQCCWVGTILCTRTGSEVILKSKQLFNVDINEKMSQYMAEETPRITGLFGLKVINNTPYPHTNRSIDFPASSFIEIDWFNEIYLKKFVYDNVIYIVSDYGNERWGEKWALSIHEDRHIDEYVMRDLINRLPIVDMDINDLITNYKIYAL